MMLKNPFSLQIKYRDGLPVLPGAFPVVGHIPMLYYGDGLRMLREGHEKLGPLFWINQAFDWVLVCDGQQGYDVLKNKIATTEHLRTLVPILLGESIFGQDGPAHHHLRSAMNGTFSPRGLTASGIGQMTAEIIQARTEQWAKCRRVRILHEAQEMTMEIIFRMLDVEPVDLPSWRQNYNVFILASYLPNHSFMGSLTARAAKARRWIDARFLSMVEETRRRPSTGALLDALVHAKDEEGRPLSDSELVDNLRFIVMAAHESTAATIAWIILTLAQRADLWAALCQEVEATPDMPVAPQDLRSFAFSEALFREVLRFYPPIILTNRKATDWITLHHHRLPPGTIIGVSPGCLSRDPKLYPDPDRFEVKRWLGKNTPPTPIELVQFGGGPHFCLGYHLAWMELIQSSVALARTMMRAGLHPRIADGPGPRQISGTVSRPNVSASVEFV
jgi:cytochrome P450 family 117 subfamily A